jgi:hypothetical protein
LGALEFRLGSPGQHCLSLRDVTYADEPVLAKVSMPVIRVKYVKEMV